MHLIPALFLSEDGHISNIVRDVELKGQMHLVDVGYGDPTFTPIPLDFAKESPVFQESYLTYKYVRQPNGKIMRLHAPLDGEEIATGYKKWFDGWWMRSEFQPDVGCDVDFFVNCMTILYHGIASRYIPYFRDVMYVLTYTDGKMVYFANHKYVLETGDGTLHTQVTTSLDELVAAYDRYLPMIPRDRVVACIENLNLKFPKATNVSQLKIVTPISKHEDLIAGTKV